MRYRLAFPRDYWRWPVLAFLVVATLPWMPPQAARAQEDPPSLPHQGRLVMLAGSSVDGRFDTEIRLYNPSDRPVAFSIEGVELDGGVFNVLLDQTLAPHQTQTHTASELQIVKLSSLTITTEQDRDLIVEASLTVRGQDGGRSGTSIPVFSADQALTGGTTAVFSNPVDIPSSENIKPRFLFRTLDEATTVRVRAFAESGNERGTDRTISLDADELTMPAVEELVGSQLQPNDSFEVEIIDGKALAVAVVGDFESGEFEVLSDELGLGPPDAQSLAVVTNEDIPVEVILESDGTGEVTFQVTDVPQHGTLDPLTTLPGRRAATVYRPAQDYFGDDSFQFEVKDPRGRRSSAAVELTVRPVNDPPVARDLHFSVNEGESERLVFRAIDVDNDTVSFAVSSSPLHGTVSQLTQIDGKTASVLYQPNENYTGFDRMKFLVSDLESAVEASVELEVIEVIGTTPVANSDFFTLLEDTILQIAASGVLANDSDPDGDPLSAELLSGPSNGTATLSLAGSLAYTPDADFFGTDSLTYRATDGVNASDPTTVTLTVGSVNDQPRVTAGGSVTVLEDSGTYAQPWASAFDAGAANESGQTLSFEVSNDNNALFDVQPAIDASGKLTFTTAANANGSANVTAILKDNGGTANGGIDHAAINAFLLTIDEVNDAPSLTVGGPVTVLEDSGAYDQPWASALRAGPANESGQTLSFEVSNDNNALFDVQPAIDASGKLTFTTAANANGSANVTAILKDNGGTANGGIDHAAINAFLLTIDEVNDAPVVTAGGTLDYTEGQPPQVIDGNVMVSDADHTSLTGAFVLIQDNFQMGADVLDFTPVGSITGSYDSSSGLLALSGTDTVANYQTTLRSVTFSNSSATPSTATRKVRYTATDGVTVSVAHVGAYATLNLTATNTPPTVMGESFDIVGNTTLELGSSRLTVSPALFVSGGLLSNDSDPDGPASLTTALVSASVTFGANVTVNSNGSFTYVPPPGRRSPDSFSYTVSDGMASSTATVTLNISNMVWYVKNDVAGAGTGVSNNPYQMLTSAQTAAAAGDVIYVMTGDGGPVDQDQGITLQATQQLIGEGVALVVNGHTLAAAGTAPVISNLVGNGVTLSSGNTVKGLTVVAAADSAIFGSGVLGTTTLDALTLQDSMNAGLRLDAADGTVTFTSGMISGGATGLDIRDGSTGTFNFGAGVTITDPGTSILVASSSANFNFAGTINKTNPGKLLDIDTYSVGTLNINGASASGSNDTTAGVTATLTNITGTVFISHMSLNSSSMSFGGPLLTIGGNNTGGSIGFDNLVLSAPSTGAVGLSASGGGTLGINNIAPTGPSSIIVGGTPLALNGMTLAAGSTLADVSSNGSNNGSSVVYLSSCTGQLTVNGGSITDSSFTTVLVSDGDVNFTYNGTVTQNNAFKIVEVTNTFGGSVTFGGTVTGGASNQGIHINNAASVVTFSGLNLGTAAARMTNQAVTMTGGTGTYNLGAVSIFTDGDPALVATDVAGTLNVTSGTIDVINAVALNVDGPAGMTNLGMTLTTFNADGGTENVILTDTAGSLTISGGTLAIGGNGVHGRNLVVTRGSINVTSSGNLSQPTPFPLLDVSGGHTGTLTFSGTLNATNGSGLQFSNADGTYSFNGTTTLNGGDAGVDILEDSAGTFTFSPAANIFNPSGRAFNVVRGIAGTSNPTVNYAGSITHNGSGEFAVNVDGTTGGSINLSGTTSAQAPSNGVNINNANGNLTFGTLTLGNGGTFMTSQPVTINGGTGTYNLGALTIFSLNVDAIGASNTGTIRSTSGLVQANGGRALNLSSATLDLTLTTVNSTGGANNLTLTNAAGSLSIGDGSLFDATAESVVIYGGTANVTYGGNITQAQNYALLSLTDHSGTLTFHTGTLSATNGTGLQFENADGTYNFNGTTALSGGAATDVVAGTDAVNGSQGTFSFGSGASVSDSIGPLFDFQSSKATFSYSGSFSRTTAATAINAQNNQGGSITFNGDGATETKSISSSTAAAINLDNNDNCTFTLSGNNLVVSTTSGAAFTATNGGTVNVTGMGNTLTSTTGTALNVQSTTIGSGGLTFQSISANGAANGIVLNDTGAMGGLTVTGTGAPNSGGVIQNTTGVGIDLVNIFSGVDISWLACFSAGDDGIRGTNVTDFHLRNSMVANNGNALGENGLDFSGLFGTATISGSTITQSFNNNAVIRNSSSPPMVLTVTGSTFSNNVSTSDGDGLLVEASGTANMSVAVFGSTFSAHHSDHFQAAALNSGILHIVFSSNNLSGGHPAALGQGITINAATGVPGYSGSVTYDVNGNTINGAVSTAIRVMLGTSSASSSFSGLVRSNIIGTTGVPLSCSQQGDGILVEARGNGTHTSSIIGNFIRRCFDRAINTTAADGNGTFNLTVTDNVVTEMSDTNAITLTPREAFHLNAGATSSNVFGQVDSHAVCLQLSGASGSLVGGAFKNGDLRVRQQFRTSVRLPGYGGTPFDTAAVATFLEGNNSGSSATATANDDAAVTTDGYFGGAACP